MKKQFWNSWRSTKSKDIWRSGGGFDKKNLQGWERRSSGKLTILLVFLRKRRRWAFSLFKQIRFRPGIHQPVEHSSVWFFLRNGLLSQQFSCSKSSEMSTLSGSSPVFVSKTLKRMTKIFYCIYWWTFSTSFMNLKWKSVRKKQEDWSRR